jgi:hypothetical protein
MDQFLIDRRSQKAEEQERMIKATQRTVASQTAAVFLEPLSREHDPMGVQYKMWGIIAPHPILQYLAEQDRFSIDLLKESLVVHSLISLFQVYLRDNPKEIRDLFSSVVSAIPLGDTDGNVFSPSATLLSTTYASPKHRAHNVIDRLIRSFDQYGIEVPENVTSLQRARARDNSYSPALDVPTSDLSHSGTAELKSAIHHSRMQSYTLAKHYGKRTSSRTDYSKVMSDMAVPVASMYKEGTPLCLYKLSLKTAELPNEGGVNG